ncbi:MAG: T9SS type A sorting domain-containing protein, partial [candidate division KSB1 bacterium]|nr:T9SS type A sorting domain-containing protein [candidate division KSB1 bacterium]
YKGTMSKSFASETATGDGWQVQIILTAGVYTDSAAWLGVSEHASKGLDGLDFRKPRTIGPVPTVYFPRPGWDRQYSIFASDIRPWIEEMESWEFEVSAFLGQACQIAFVGVEEIPDQLAVYLIDQTSARRVNLRDMAVYWFTPIRDITKFCVIVGKEAAVDEKLSAVLPTSFSLGSNYPNPFNATTTIPISVPIKTELSLKVYNTLGEAVKTLYTGTLEPGQYQFHFDGSDETGRALSSGVYMYQLTASGNVRLLGKMILMK